MPFTFFDRFLSLSFTSAEDDPGSTIALHFLFKAVVNYFKRDGERLSGSLLTT